MNRRHALLAACAVSLPWMARATGPTTALPPEIASELPGARLQGDGRMRFMGLNIYDASLWTEPGFQADRWERHALALALRYARALDGRRIAERSITEMKRVGTVTLAQEESWLEQMGRLFPDVQAGDRLSGIQRPGESARFFFNGKPRGDVQDAEFARLFFGIWLSPRTAEPALRDSLLNPKATR